MKTGEDVENFNQLRGSLWSQKMQKIYSSMDMKIKDYSSAKSINDQ